MFRSVLGVLGIGFGVASCLYGQGAGVNQRVGGTSGGTVGMSAVVEDATGVGVVPGSFRERYNRAGQPHFLGVIVPWFEEIWEGDSEGNGERLSKEQIEIIQSAFASVCNEAGAKITFASGRESWMQEKLWPSRFFLQPQYAARNFWRADADMVVEVAAAYRAETPSRWEMVALLYDVGRFGGLLFSANSNELFGFVSQRSPEQVRGVRNLRTVSRRVANYLLQRARLPAFDYPY
jgi:hypothetical protein